MASLSAVFTPGYSKLRQAEAELTAIQSTYDQTRADIITHIENDYHESARREDLLATAYDAQTRTVTGQDEKAIQYNILKREVESSRQLYDTMLQQTKQASIASALHASNVRVVDPAEIPDFPVFPNFKLNAALGLFAGIFSQHRDGDDSRTGGPHITGTRRDQVMDEFDGTRLYPGGFVRQSSRGSAGG